jgi:hypothetical protein
VWATHEGAASALETDAYLRVAAALAARHAREREALLTAQRAEVDAAAAVLSRGFHMMHDAPLEPPHATPHTPTALTQPSPTSHTAAFVSAALVEQSAAASAVVKPHLQSPPPMPSQPRAGLPACYFRDVDVRELTLTTRGFLALLSTPAVPVSQRRDAA